MYRWVAGYLRDTSTSVPRCRLRQLLFDRASLEHTGDLLSYWNVIILLWEAGNSAEVKLLYIYIASSTCKGLSLAFPHNYWDLGIANLWENLTSMMNGCWSLGIIVSKKLEGRIAKHISRRHVYQRSQKWGRYFLVLLCHVSIQGRGLQTRNKKHICNFY
jgi:hypothetical protein